MWWKCLLKSIELDDEVLELRLERLRKMAWVTQCNSQNTEGKVYVMFLTRLDSESVVIKSNWWTEDASIGDNTYFIKRGAVLWVCLHK